MYNLKRCSPLPPQVSCQRRIFDPEIPELRAEKTGHVQTLESSMTGEKTKEAHNTASILTVCQFLCIGPLEQEIIGRRKLRREAQLAE